MAVVVSDVSDHALADIRANDATPRLGAGVRAVCRNCCSNLVAEVEVAVW